MKRIIILITLCLTVCVGCRIVDYAEPSPQTVQDENAVDTVETEPPEEPEDEDGIFVDPVDTVSFSTLEEFNDAILYAKEGGDLSDIEGAKFADLDGIDMYCLPTNLPEGFRLYYVTAGASGIRFTYLPEDCLTDALTANSAETQAKDFIFIYSRGVGSELAEGEYTVEEDIRDRIYWSVDGHNVALYMPKGYEGDYGELVGAEVVYVK